MAEKILNTRVQLKYDLLANWEAIESDNTKILKAGEVAAVAIPEKTTVDKNGQTITTAPTVLFKVGDGTSVFKSLPWLSALAADVHAWAKKDWAGFVADVQANAGLVTANEFDTFKANVIGTAADELTATTIYGKIAELEDIADANAQALTNVYTKNETYNTNEVDALVKEAKDLVTADGGVAGKLDKLSSDFNTFTTVTAPATYADKSVETTKANAADVYTKNETYTKGEVDGLVDDAKALITGTNGVDSRLDALETFKDTTVPGTYATKGELSTAVTNLKSTIVDGKVTDTDTSETIAGAKAYADKKINDLLTAYILDEENGGTTDAIDKLQEVAAWINNDTTGATKIVADIDDLKTAVNTINQKELTDTTYAFTDGTEGKFTVTPEGGSPITVNTGAKAYADGAVAAAIGEASAEGKNASGIHAVIEAGDAAANGRIDGLASRVDELEKVDHAHTSSLAEIEDAVAKKHEHTNKTVLDGITADKVSAWDAAEQNAKDYADGLNDAMDARVDAIETDYVRVGTDGKLYQGKTTGDNAIILVISGGSASTVW